MLALGGQTNVNPRARGFTFWWNIGYRTFGKVVVKFSEICQETKNR